MLAMFVAHGYDAWVAPAAKVGLGYRVTREIAAAAIPSFFFLAGLSIGMRWARVAPGEHAAMRSALALRGLRLIAGGYGLSLAYAALDGGLGQPEIWLRSDVLHAIGASILVVVALLIAVRTDGSLQVGSQRATERATLRLGYAAIGLACLTVMLWPLVVAHWSGASGPIGYALAPFLPVKGITRFAALPLAAFCCVGLAWGIGKLPATFPRSAWAFVLAVGVACALIAAPDVQAWIDGKPRSDHAALRFNALGGFGRALCVLTLGSLLPARVLPPFALLGRHSLLLYATHIPFCYGRFGKPLRARLDLAQASLALAVLTGAALLLAACFEAYSTRQAGRRSGA